jgi:hypothetical protein
MLGSFGCLTVATNEAQHENAHFIMCPFLTIERPQPMVACRDAGGTWKATHGLPFCSLPFSTWIRDGNTIEPWQVRLITHSDDSYTWKALPEKQHLPKALEQTFNWSVR